MAKRERGGVLAGVLTIIGFIVLAAVLGGLYVARNVHVQTTARTSGDNVSIDIPGGHFSIQANEKMDPAALGVPVYPGARKKGNGGGGASFQWSSSDGKDEKGAGFAVSEMISEDSPGKVLAWYKTQLPNWVVVVEDDKVTRFEMKEGGHKRLVAIKEERGETHIVVATVGEPASN